MTAEAFDTSDQLGHRFNQLKLAEEHLTGVELDMFTGYREYLLIELGIDPYNATPDQTHLLTDGAHAYVANIVDNKIDALNGRDIQSDNDTDDETIQGRKILDIGRKARTARGHTIFSIPRAPITRRIKNFYREFGVHRRLKDQVAQEIEEKRLSEGISTLISGVAPLQPGQTIPRRSADYITRGHPEVAIALRLEEILRELNLETAADSVQVLNWAYGNRFQELSSGVGNMARKRSRVTTYFDIPADEMPDHPMPPRRPQ